MRDHSDRIGWRPVAAALLALTIYTAGAIVYAATAPDRFDAAGLAGGPGDE